MFAISHSALALGFGKSSKASINGVEIEPPYTADAPLLRGLTVWLTGSTLLETVLLNLVPSPQMNFPDDAPSWNWRLRKITRSTDKWQTPHCAARGIMDCFTWQSRLIRLIPESENGQTVVRNVYFTQGRSITDRTHFDAMKIYLASKKGRSFAIVTFGTTCCMA